MKKLSLILLIVLAFSSCHRANLPQEQPRTIAFSELCELGTVEYTVTKIVRASDDAKWYTIGDRKILFSCTAHLKAGIDMSNFDSSNVVISGNDISVTLPHAELLSINLPANESKLVYEHTSPLRFHFSATERNNLLRQGEDSIIANINSYGILAEAEANAVSYLTALLHERGFNNVTINFE